MHAVLWLEIGILRCRLCSLTLGIFTRAEDVHLHQRPTDHRGTTQTRVYYLKWPIYPLRSAKTLAIPVQTRELAIHLQHEAAALLR